MIGTLIRSTSALVLSGTAKALGAASSLAEVAAATLRPDARRPDATRKKAQSGTAGKVVDRAQRTADEAADSARQAAAAVVDVTERASEEVARGAGVGRPGPGGGRREQPARERFPDTSAPPPAREAPADQALDSVHLREPESHVAELAAKPADQVIRAVANLSTDELEHLYDYETSHKNRKSVLAAIARESAPPGRETVYSTQTTPRGTPGA